MYTQIWKLIRAAGIFLAVWLLGKTLLPLFLPFLLGAGLALAAEPMASFFRKRLRLPRAVASGISVSMAFCFLGILGLLLCALVVRELRTLAGILPDLTQAAQEGLNGLQQRLVEASRKLPGDLGPTLSHSVTALFSDGNALPEKAIGYLLGAAGTILSHIPDSFLGVGTAVISGYMISAKLPRIKDWILEKLPREKLRPILETLKRLRSTVASYLTAQIKLSAVTFGLLLAGFLILKIRYAPVWALVISLVDAFPVLGTGTVLLPWALVSGLQGDTAQAIGLGGIYTVVCVTRSVLEPKLLGKHLGLDPLLTLMAMYAGFRLWGIGGMILAPMLCVTAAQLLPERNERGT